jgi:hypothetical protein
MNNWTWLLLAGLGVFLISGMKKSGGTEWSPELLAAIKQQNQAARAATYTKETQDYIVGALSTLDKASQEAAIAAIKAGADPLTVAQSSAYGFYLDPVTGQMYSNG